MRDFVKRIAVFLAILLLFAIVLFVSVFAVVSRQNGAIEDAVYDYTEKYVNAVAKKEISDVSADSELMLSSMSESLTGKAFDEITGSLSSAYQYVSAGSKTVNNFEKKILSVDIDRRYGSIVATARSFVRFDGWGEYLTGETTNINMTCVCLDIYTMQKVDGVWKIASIKTEFEGE